MKLRKVDPHSIKVPELRVRAQFDEELFRQFQESIKAVGQISPPICYEVGEELVLCDGEHRLIEAKNNGDKMIDVVVIPGDMIDVLTKNIFLDHLRGKTPVPQMVKVISALYQEYNLDVDRIQEKTGLTRDYIEKLIKIGTAGPSVQEALDSGRIGVGKAFQIGRLPSELQREALCNYPSISRMTEADVKEMVELTLKEMALLKEAPPPDADKIGRTPSVYLCEGCKVEVDPRYLRPIMVCPNCFGEIWRLGKARATRQAEGDDEGEGG